MAGTGRTIAFCFLWGVIGCPEVQIGPSEGPIEVEDPADLDLLEPEPDLPTPQDADLEPEVFDTLPDEGDPDLGIDPAVDADELDQPSEQDACAPTEHLCNGLDDNCDSRTDEGWEATVEAVLQSILVDPLSATTGWLATGAHRFYDLDVTLAAQADPLGSGENVLVLRPDAANPPQWMGIQRQGEWLPGATESLSVELLAPGVDGPDFVFLLIEDRERNYWRHTAPAADLGGTAWTEFSFDLNDTGAWSEVRRRGDERTPGMVHPVRPATIGVLGSQDPVFFRHLIARSIHSPLDRLSMALSTNRLGNVFHQGEPVSVQVSLTNPTDIPLSGTLQGRVVDYYGTTTPISGDALVVEPGERVQVDLPIPLDDPGLFTVDLSLSCLGAGTPRSIDVGYNPPSEPYLARPDSPFGINTMDWVRQSFGEDRMQLLWDAGIHWKRTPLYWHEIEPSQGHWAWDTAEFIDDPTGHHLHLLGGDSSHEAVDASSIDLPATTGELSLVFRIRLEDLDPPVPWPWVVSKVDHQPDGAIREYLVYYANAGNQLALSLGNGPDRFEDRACGKSDWVPDSWYQVVMSYRRSTREFRCYVEGDLSSTDSFSLDGLLMNTAAPVTIGGQFAGGLDDLRIYSRVLHDSEVAQLQAGENVTNGLVAYWQFDPGADDSVPDVSGNHNTLVAIEPYHDGLIDEYRSHGILSYGNVLFGSAWAYDPTTCSGVSENQRHLCKPLIGAFREYVARTVERYRDRVSVWSVWNEPNGQAFWQPEPDAAEYADVLCAAQETLHLGNTVPPVCPECIVLGLELAGPTPWWGPTFLEELVAQGGASCMDGISIHPYRGPQTPEETHLEQDIADIRALVGNIPIWFGEVGWTTPVDPSGVDERFQAAMTSRIFLHGLALGIDKLFLYNERDCGPDLSWGEHHFGLLRYDYVPKPAYYAYQTTSRLLADASFVQGDVQGDVHAYQFSRESQTITAVWSTPDSHLVAITVEGQPIEVTRLMGDVVHLSPVGSVALVQTEEEPLFLGPTSSPSSLLGEVLSVDPHVLRVDRGSAASFSAHVTNLTGSPVSGSLDVEVPSAEFWVEEVPQAIDLGAGDSTDLEIGVHALETAPLGVHPARFLLTLEGIEAGLPVAVTVVPPDLPVDPVAFFRLEGVGDGGMVTDDSPFENHGTATGAPEVVSGMARCALRFNGSTDSISIPDSDTLDLADELTISFWVRIAGATGQWQNVLRKWEGDTRSLGVYFNLDSGDFCFTATYGENFAGSFTDHCSGFSVWDNTWHHLAVTYSAYAQQLWFYVDGGLVREQDVPFGELALTDAPLVLMDQVPGSLDQLRIHHRWLGPDEVWNIYDSDREIAVVCPLPP